METRGRSAHGATPERGRNAVHEMARIVDALETRYRGELRRHRHPLLGNPTASVGVIRGGTQANIVPERCIIEVDRRTLPGETAAGVHRELRRLVRRMRCRVWFHSAKDVPCLPLETNPQMPWVRRLMDAAGQRAGCGVHYFCDAAVLADGGTPSVVFGPGDIAQAHTADEWISRTSLNHSVLILGRFLRGLP
jgi:acetylornithine deacetylase/succinyl-diaminopimelate desuccinylase-like protein